MSVDIRLFVIYFGWNAGTSTPAVSAVTSKEVQYICLFCAVGHMGRKAATPATLGRP